MPDVGRTHIFVSYATEDALFVDWLCLRLLNEGYSVWCDRLKLLGGESYPLDIDEAIRHRTYRFITVLSRNSIIKPNPVKERTCALNIARERKENFVIPLNVDGLAGSELGWMQSDLTFIPFTNWREGFAQLLKNLAAAGAPRGEPHKSVAALLGGSRCVASSTEALCSNLVPLRHIPTRLYRYEHEVPMTESSDLGAAAVWPHYRENSGVCWTFQPPPPDLCTPYRFAQRGTCEGWRTATGPDVNFYNLGKKVINATLFHRLLSAGLRFDAESRDLYVPNEKRFARLTFRGPDGGSWIKAVGLRSFQTAEGREAVRYHLSPNLRAWLDFGGRDFVRVGIRLYLTQVDGTPVKPALMQSRRKVICKSWWNHQWLSRILATLQLIASSDSEIRIGVEPDEQLILERFPMTLTADRALLDDYLKSREQTQEFVELMDRAKGGVSMPAEDEGEDSGVDAPTA